MPIKPNPYKLVCPKCEEEMERDNPYENNGLQRDYLNKRNGILSIFDIFKK